tara:strand:- start:109 stop:837 length:729 start_codon:yes stop_codon:yes gene_type:complete
MKYALILALVSLFSFACSQNTTELEERIAVLEKKQYETFANINDLQGALDETSKALSDFQLAVKENEPAPASAPRIVTPEEAYQDIFARATRVDKIDIATLMQSGNCRVISSFNVGSVPSARSVEVEVAFARLDGGMEEIPDDLVLFHWMHKGSGTSQHTNELSFERVLANPWNSTQGTFVTTVYRGVSVVEDIYVFPHDYNIGFTTSTEYPSCQDIKPYISPELRPKDIVQGSFIVAWYVE